MAESTAHRLQAWGHGLAIAGVALVVAGLTWNSWKQAVPDSMFWSEEDAREYSQAYEAAHSATIGPDHSHDEDADGSDHPGDSEPLDEARRRFQAAADRLERARGAHEGLGRVIAIGGGVVAALGLVLARQAQGRGA